MLVKFNNMLVLVLITLSFTGIVIADDPLGCCCDLITNTSSTVTELECAEFNSSNPWIIFPPNLQTGSVNFTGRNQFCAANCPSSIISNPSSTTNFLLNGTVYNGSTNNYPLRNAIAYLNIQGTTTAGTTNQNGYFEIINVPNQMATLYITHPKCLTQTNRFSLNANNYSEFHLDCSENICSQEPFNVLSVSQTTSQLAIDVKPTPISPFTCTPNNAGILVCLDPQKRNCITQSYDNVQDALSQNSIRFNLGDHGFGENGWISNTQQKLYVWFFANYGSNTVYSTKFMDYTLGDPTCYLQQGSFCQEQTPSSCNGVILTKGDSCQTNEYCYDSGTVASCQLQLNCENCNSITYSFADIFWIFNNVQDVENNPFPDQVRCTDTRIGSPATPASCALSAESSSRNFYEQCDQINSCYDYTTRTSCEGANGNPCGVSNNCEWVSAIPSVLGKGICKPTTQELDCKQCTYQFGDSCDESFCSSLSDGSTSCALATRGINNQLCVAVENFACVDYVSQTECVGNNNQSSLYNIQYSSNNPSTNDYPIGGNNSQIRKSNDLYGIGACSWGKRSNGDLSCIKDSNMDGWNDDCGAGNFFLALQCITDIKPPTTYLPLIANQILDITSLKEMDVIVEDNLFSNIGLTTYYCLQGQGLTCNYPNSSLGGLTIDASGEYILKYFSKDASNNYEVVRNITLFLQNVTIPEIEQIVLVPR